MEQRAATADPSGETEADTGHAPVLAKLKRLGVQTLGQALMCIPRGYTDYSDICTLREAIPREGVLSEPKVFSLVVSERAVIVAQPKKRVVLTATDGMLSVKVVIFVVPGADVPFWKALEVGARFHVLAALQSWAGRLQITGPKLVPEQMVGKIVPRYQGKRGVVAAQAIMTAVRLALPEIEAGVRHVIDFLGGMPEAEILRHARLTTPSLAVLLRALHGPDTLEEGEAAIQEARRLAAYAVVWQAKQLKRRPEMPESAIPITLAMIRDLAAKLPKKLTGDQRRTIREICADLEGPHPMRRVLSGDVGCGKTYAYMIPALAAQQLGRQVVVLTPNSLLVDQFAQECREVFGANAPVVAITGASKKHRHHRQPDPGGHHGPVAPPQGARHHAALPGG